MNVGFDSTRGNCFFALYVPRLAKAGLRQQVRRRPKLLPALSRRRWRSACPPGRHPVCGRGGVQDPGTVFTAFIVFIGLRGLR